MQVKTIYGDPRPFAGGVEVGACYLADGKTVKCHVSVYTPDGLHFIALDEETWDLFAKEVKERFREGAKP